MRLRNIKLSGFKSFVDPTTLTVPGQIVGVVGPNGCGKSNIIDAVTWVMGESSAKHLRGDSLTDVIFNGSTARQPVSQAAVELIFDNSEKKVGGQYASYNEISIKRQINREAVSTYYLNGARCRRRDITDLFLGTGLGPRGYSIIEQGMISRLIEAKPDELRVFIEEAAGISKYRERRRETENRIRHTKENISRLNDIQEELEKQLNHLHRQAKAAERYKILKTEERQVESELLALNWKELKSRSEEDEVKIRDAENQVQSAIAGLREVEKNAESKRDQLVEANDVFNEKQSVFYQLGADISQLEQSIKHTRERIDNNQEELKQSRTQLDEVEKQFQQDTENLERLQNEATSLEPKLLGSRGESDKAYEGLNRAEEAMQSWQSEWDRFNETSSNYQRTSQVNTARKEHLDDSLQDLVHRLQTLTEEFESIDPGSLENSLSEKKQAVAEAESGFHSMNEELKGMQASLSEFENTQRQQQDALHQQREAKQKISARLETLRALQESAYGEGNKQIKAWLESNQLNNAARLAQKLQMDHEWSTALETVLTEHLQAVYVDDISAHIENLGAIESGSLELIQTGSDAVSQSTSGQTTLADKIHSPVSLKNLVSGIYVCEELNDALNIRNQLAAGESVVTRDGVWMSRDWIRVSRSDAADASLITREQDISELAGQLEITNNQIQKTEQTLLECRNNIEQQNNSIRSLNERLQLQQTTVSELKGELVATESQIEQLQQRAEKIREQLDELEITRERDQAELLRLNQELSETENFSEDLEQQKQQLVSMREQHRQSLDGARQQWQQTHEESHGIALQLEAISSQKASLEQAIKRNELQVEHIRRRCQELESSLNETTEPLQLMQTNLESRLQEKITSEQNLASARSSVQEIETDIRNLEQKRNESEQQTQEKREALEKIKLASQETRVRLQTIEEQFASKEVELKTVLEELTEEANQNDWKEKLESLGRKIQRLGPINLAAIDEHAQLSERKEYLDSQEADLSQALETLEAAIRKIDLETKSRFRETFDKLNENLKETFPKIFGGGHAYLELTSEDLLETGITVMARPPGKRNTTIHLLSGGEKALTAVSLVFAIFKLNPAPFCILDEVDAPLDDANAGRFSELVKSMSDDVQFIVITHNKITMEIAQQLLGVTMHEPGVSRLVTVDVDAAVEMAATA